MALRAVAARGGNASRRVDIHQELQEGMASSILTAKANLLKARKEETKMLSSHAHGVARQVELAGADTASRGGCSAGVCAWISRRFRGGRSRETRRRAAEILASVEFGDPATSVSSTSSTGTAAASASGSSVAVHRAVFGLAGAAKSDPAKKLEEAAQVMRARIEQLESRAMEARSEAASLARVPGKKPQALRALKKAKQIDAQVESNQAALDACEQQQYYMESAAIQKTLTSALASTSKSMKGDAKLLSKAEKAVDDAQDARDVANDLNEVVADFASRGNGDMDDDELLAELEELAAEPPPDTPMTSTIEVGEETEEEGQSAAERAMAALASKHAKIDADRALRATMPATPAVGIKAIKKQEREKLLAVS